MAAGRHLEDITEPLVDETESKPLIAARRGAFRSVLIHDFRPEDPRAPWLGWSDLAHPLREHPWLPPDAMYVGKTILELSDLIGPAQAEKLRVLVTWFWSVEAVLPFDGDDVVVFCLGDEWGRKPSYSHDVRLVAKTGGATRRPYIAFGSPSTWPAVAPALLQEMRGQLRIAPGAVRSTLRTSRARRRANLVEIPVGTFWLSPVPFVPFDARRYDISFAGSMKNDAQQGALLPQKTRSRLRMLAALNAAKDARPDLRVAIRMLDVFSDVGNHRAGYSEEIMQTRFVLCPRGGSRETFRVFEAAASGCIPITEKLPRRAYYEGCPAVQLRSWTQLPKALDRLLANGEALQRRHEAVLEWWDSQATPRATAVRIARGLQR